MQLRVVVSALLHPKAITLVFSFSPLKRLQHTKVNELNSYEGIDTIAFTAICITILSNGRLYEKQSPIDGHSTVHGSSAQCRFSIIFDEVTSHGSGVFPPPRRALFNQHTRI
ncbi:hypothetical protein FA95DRAFT_1596821 [Auriscalpium vulgare]|uniref:Uncharacterized protein n=1 Tax=Auriscalpium vulgare TaxID=40419 RepID=A0ACB8RMP8_9AGAM|nr:hypothetical protein FA95DRAFT_1596821 [Auriscalpium vulgare]